MVDRSSYIPLYIQVRDKIKQQLEKKQYLVGDMIPGEKSLMEEFGVGRATIREAVNHLVMEGLLEKRQGIGTFVCAPKKTIGFEPLISLSYIFRHAGHQLENELLYKGQIQLSAEKFGFSRDQVFKIERLRYYQSNPVIMETFLFRSEFETQSQGYDFTKSIGQLLLNTMDLPIAKVGQEVVMERPNQEVSQRLNIRSAQATILLMKRWLYLETETEPYQYYEMRVSPEFSQLSLQNILMK